MKKSKFSETQIVTILKQADAGVTLATVAATGARFGFASVVKR